MPDPSRIARRLADAADAMARRLTGRAPLRQVSFLHIGKAAGSEIAAFAAEVNRARGDLRLIVHDHGVWLCDLPLGREYFFSIRDPASRFRSGFYSRKRMGRPHYERPWSAHEARAFADFDHANDLAEALSDQGEAGRKALFAIRSISHTAMNQVDWFVKQGHLLALRPPLGIVRQEHFAADFARVCAALGLAVPAARNNGPRTHGNDYAGIPELSEKALANLRAWYRQDYAFYAACEDWIEGRG